MSRTLVLVESRRSGWHIKRRTHRRENGLLTEARCGKRFYARNSSAVPNDPSSLMAWSVCSVCRDSAPEEAQ